MKKSIEILNHPEQVRAVLSSLRNDSHLSKTFEGNAKNGVLSGFYTNLALINDMVIGYVKIKGIYDSDKGDLNIQIVPSNLFWLVIAFITIPFGLSIYKGVTENNMIFIGSLVCVILAFGWTIAFILESKSFIKHINRITNLTFE